MNVNWDAIGAGAELLGALATVSMLAYLAIQIRQSNKIARLSAITTRVERRTQLSSFLAQTPEINRIFWVGLKTPDALNEDDYHYFEAIFSTVLASYEAGFYLRSEDSLFVAEWEVVLKGLEWLLANPCFERYWSTWKHNYAVDFVSFIDQLVDQSDAIPAPGSSCPPLHR